MVKTSHNKTIRINAAGDYQINSDNEFIVIDTIGVVTLHFPHMLKDNDRVNIIAVTITPSVRALDGTGSEFAALTTDFGYMQVEYNTSADAYVFRELVAPPTPPSGDSGWSLSEGVFSTILNSDLGVSVDSINPLASNVDYLTVVDASVGDVTADLTSIETIGPKYIKQIKVTGPYDLILQSTAGFSDGSNEIIITDSAIIFFDGTIWQILYNNEWKTKTVDISSAEILTLGSAPVELLPAPGVGKYYDVDSILTKYTHETTAYSTFADLAFLIGNQFYNVIGGMITVSDNSFKISVDVYPNAYILNQSLNLTTTDGSDPTLGDGTLQIIIKYKTLTF